MRSRFVILLGLALVFLVGGLWWWRNSTPGAAGRNESVTTVGGIPPSVRQLARAATTNQETVSESTAPLLFSGQDQINAVQKDPLAYRLANTPKNSEQLLQDNRAIILENALIDSSQPLGFQIPAHLKLTGDAGSYIIQSRGVIDAAFRAAIAGAGAEFVSYVPNNAWLVRASQDEVNRLAASGETQSVLPWEPVYKLKSELLGLALEDKQLPPGTKLNLLVYSDARAEVLAQLSKFGATPIAEDRSPFGAIITVQPGEDWTALALLPGVQIMEQAYLRGRANDLTRVRIGVATNSTTTTNHLGLTGTNVLVSINDSGVDANHPDFELARLFALNAQALTDTNGHGTHVAAILAGSGLASTNVVNARGSLNPGTNGQYRGVAPGVKLFVQATAFESGSIPDATLQENVAQTNAFISNNSWNYIGNSSYSLAAASYDAAVRDSLPGVPGSQPVLYVFSAGNSGSGSDAGLSGNPGSVLSPATAKNVLSVGAIELARDITNIVTKISGVGTNQTTNTSTPWRAMTSSGNQVASFSARGNVGVRIEGEYGRVKPDVMAPGTFVVSARSTTWDEVAYYNPTNHNYTRLRNQVVATNGFNTYSIFLPDNAVGFTLTLLPNDDSPVPFPGMPIYVRRDDIPTPGVFDLRRTNSVAVPPDLGGVGTFVGQNWYYGIGNLTDNSVNFDILTDVMTTNDLGDYYTVLSNLNNSISGTNDVGPHFYRYESGTSMAAPAASGTLALMQEFFEQRLKATNSPALMKALLINGARSVGNLYDHNVRSSINYQGWGLMRLANSLPAGISNAFDWSPSAAGAIKIVDQSPTNALATGQSQSRVIKLSETAQTLPLRVTLAWTDPPGNPAVGVKLVNDLDLVVTNLDTGDIYLGNDISVGSTFNFAWDTNAPPNFDSVNNIENVFVSPLLGTNYAIAIIARRVNVNAVTAHTNDVVQDYALVVSSGNGETTNAITFVSQTASLPTEPADVVFVTNSIVQPDFVAAALENQRVGANAPLLSGVNGVLGQWKFYVVTNTTDFTNATFLVSQQTDLAPHRMGVFTSRSEEVARRFADIDMYISLNNNLTNLVPAVVGASFQSLSRNDLSGDEYLIFEDSIKNRVYYVGVKSEDHMGAEYEFFAIFSLLPLGQEDANGFVRAYPMSGYDIPDGTPSNPGGARFVAITRPSLSGTAESVRRVVITNNVSHENYGDVTFGVEHNSRGVVLDNHRSIDTPLPPGPYAFLYDDSGEGDFPNAFLPDGPGELRTFIGEAPNGTWYFTYTDDALTQVGAVSNVMIRVERQCESDVCDPVTNTVAGNGWRYFSRNIPVEATNFTVCIQLLSPQPQDVLQLYIRKGARPTQTQYDFTRTITTAGGCLTIDKSTLPPLQSGRYFIGVFNPRPNSQTFTYQSFVHLGVPPTPTLFSGNTGSTPILDDAVTNYTQFVTNDAAIARLDVGLRIDHPRVSDLAATLVSPRGTRVLLVENRGGTDPNGFGSTLVVSNFVPVGASGGAAAQTNFVDTGATIGFITIDYEFFQAPDQMTVYYEGTQLTNTTSISGSGRFSLNYGPGTSTIIEVRMNESGNANTNTAWNYTISSISSSHSYLIFTDNTNRTTTPVKFALPPFVGTPGSTIPISDFEYGDGVFSGDYVGPSSGLPDGWDVLTNTVTVIANTANTGVQSLALRSGVIQRTLATTSGQNYRLNYAYRRASGSNDIISWWPAEGSGIDIVGGNHGVMTTGAGFAPGLVNSAFTLDGVQGAVLVADNPSLDFGPGQDFSIEAWIRPEISVTTFGTMTIADKRNSPSTDRSVGYAFYLVNGQLTCQLADAPLAPLSFSNYGPAGPDMRDGAFHHVAMVVDRSSTTGGQLYVDGQLVLTFDPTLQPGDLSNSQPLWIGRHAETNFNGGFKGVIDELTLYGRALSAGEVQAVFAAGAAGKCGMIIPPAVCSPPLGAQISVPGQAANAFLGTTNWQQGGLIFTAVGANTTVNLAPIVTNAASGVLVDSFTLTESASSRYVLPEESLKVLEGENAYGEWKLEIIDTRTGAFNNVSLLDWQLQFIFQTDTAVPTVLTPGVPKTNTVCAGKIDYYIVDVPTWSRFATNELLFATGPLNVYFNQNIRPAPSGTNTPPDYKLLIGQSSGVVTITTNLPVLPPPAGPPTLVPGQRYYIGIENPSTNSCVTYAFLVDFDLVSFPPVVTLTNGVPYCALNRGPAGATDYYLYTVSSNAVRAQFELYNLSGDMTLFLRRGLPPTFGVFDYLSANVFTNDEVITVFDFTQPVELEPGDWYLGAANVFGPSVFYCVKATEWPIYGTNIVITNTFVSSNSFCLTWTSLPGVRYYVEGLTDLSSTNWAVVSPTIVATGYSTTWCLALPSPFHFFRVREGMPLNTYVPPPVISSIRRTFRGIEITWGGPVTAQYQVQWSPTLVPAVWTTFPIPPAVTSTTGLFQFLDDGTQTVPPGLNGVRYYRLLLLP